MSQNSFLKKTSSDLDQLLKELEEAKLDSEIRGVVKASLAIANHYYRQEHNYSEAIEMASNSLALVDGQSESFLEEQAMAYRILGSCKYYQGQLQISLQHYIDAEKCLLKIEDPSENVQNELAGLYHNMAILFKDQNDNESRIRYLNRSLEIYEETGSKSGLARCYNALSTYYHLQEDFEKDLDYQQKSLKLKEEIGDQFGVAVSYNNLGGTYQAVGEREKAEHYLRKSLELKKEVGTEFSIAMSYTSLALFYKEDKKYEETESLLLRALKITKDLEAEVEINKLYDYLATLHAEMGNFEKAYKYQTLHNESIVKIFDIEKAKSIADTTAKYRYEQKRREAEIFKQKAKEIKKYVVQLERSNNDLKQFAHVASHDLKEPLRMISNYMELLRRRLNDRLGEDEVEYIDFAINGAKRMNDLINDLLALSKINNTEIPSEKVDLNNTLELVCKNLESQINKAGAFISYQDLPVVFGDPVQLIQLFQNLVSNGVKYNESDIPKVIVHSKESSNQTKVYVTDNGIGINEEYRKKIFQIFQRLHNYHEYSGTGIGLAICKRIVERHHGNIEVQDAKEGGTTFVLTFPKY